MSVRGRFAPAGVLATLRALWREVDLYRGGAADQQPVEARALDNYQRRLTRLGVQVTGLVMIGLVLLAWPSDFLIFQQDAVSLEAVLRWRLALLCTCSAGLVALRFVPRLAQRPFLVALVAFGLSLAASGWLMGRVGSLASPLFYGVYTTPLLTVLLVVGLPARALATGLLLVAYFLGYFAADPGHLHEPGLGTPLVWVAASAVTAVIVGHLVTTLLRSNFRQQRALERMTVGLERRVAEQTAELVSLASNLVNVQEQERRRIAREIHDELGQTLTGLRMELEHLRRSAGPGTPLAEGFGRAAGLLDSVHDALDRVLTALRPKVLDTRGLTAALESLLGAMQRTHRVECRLQVGVDEERLSPEQTIALYRIAQEALTNAARHARASHVELLLDEAPGGMRLTLSDDGQGFDPAQAEHHGRLGLLGIRERSRLLGGRCNVHSRPGSGTRVEVDIPCSPDHSAGRAS
jgi:signal transduction histidine kinase